MPRARTRPWYKTDGNGTYEMCTTCTMQVIKFYEGRSTTPIYAALVRQDEQGHLLINEPTGVAYGKRTARWLDPKNIRVEWIRNFQGV